jgi:RES domain-containing protein
LPENWDAKPPILETQLTGDDFVISNSAAVLKVPSAIVPPEFNYLINPNHPNANKITVLSKTPLTFDQRLKKTL